MEKNNLQWFKDRVGKKVYRTKSSCNCMVCSDVFEFGLYIADEFHANYLFDCQNDLDLYYFDEKPKENDTDRRNI
jgi:hypothetical protein